MMRILPKLNDKKVQQTVAWAQLPSLVPVVGPAQVFDTFAKSFVHFVVTDFTSSAGLSIISVRKVLNFEDFIEIGYNGHLEHWGARSASKEKCIKNLVHWPVFERNNCLSPSGLCGEIDIHFSSPILKAHC